MVWYLHFLIFRYTCNVDTAYNTPCLHLILGTSGCTAWWHLAHCCAIFHMHFNEHIIHALLNTCWWEKYPKCHNVLSLLAFFVALSFVRMIMMVVMMMVILNIMIKLLLMIMMPFIVTIIEAVESYATKLV